MYSVTVALVLLRVTFALLASLLLALCLKKSSASVRSHVLLLGVLGALVLPFASWAAAQRPVVALAAPPAAVHVVAEALTARATSASSTPLPARAPRAPDAFAWHRAIAALWLLGTALVGVRTCASLVAAGRLRARSRRVGELCFSAEIAGPVVLGLFSPVILLPTSAAAWSPERLEAALLHERSHVRRRDGLVLLLARVVCALYWFLPLAWWLASRLRRECELVADETVIAAGVRPSTYAEHLLAIARDMQVPVSAVAMAASTSELGRRIEVLVGRGASAQALSARRATLLALGAALLVVLVACTGTVSSPSVARAPEPGAGRSASVQQLVVGEAARARDDWGAKRVAIVVLDAKNGAVLANSDDEASAPVVPASALKPLTVALALDARAIDVGQRFDCGNGQRQYGERTLSDAAAYGSLDAAQILAVSSNVGVSRIFDALGGAKLGAGLERFHVPVPADVEGGSLRGAIIAMGGGSTTTPLALARAYAVLANDGRDPNGTRVVSPEAAQSVRGMLEGAVTGELATGRAAAVAGARVGGKTGTSAEEDCENCARVRGLFATFVGIAPIDQPRYVIYVGVGEPTKPGTGGTIAAPVFARLAARLLARG